MQFDIKNYYQSISKELFVNVLDFATHYMDVTEEEKSIINVKKSVLIYKSKQWINSYDHFTTFFP